MRRIMTLILATMLAGQAWAGWLKLCSYPKTGFDFAAVCDSGQTLYYTIISDTEPYAVAVTCPYKTHKSIKCYNQHTKPTGDLVIPEAVSHNGKTYSVAKISHLAFANCENITSITIPNSVDEIGEGAFFGCVNLKSVQLPDSIKYISDYLFDNCSSLTSIEIPESVTLIGGHAFAYCKNLTSITIPESVWRINWYAFGYCENLTSITIPKSVTDIETYAFEGCSALTSVTINSESLYINFWVFVRCTKLTEINFSENNITYSSENGVVFNKDKTELFYCPEGKTGTYTIPNTVKTIWSNAFIYSNLTSISIPNSVSEIGYSAFCSDSLYSITIPNSVEKIYGGAFCGKKLTVYCEASSKPKEWDRKWNKGWHTGRTPVVWGKNDD